MYFSIRGLLHKRPAQALNYAIQQYRLLATKSNAKTTESTSKLPHLIKAIQGSSKEELMELTNERRVRSNRYGEDSWFMNSTPKAEVMGVADGVGGWRKMGIDAGIFAKELMCRCSNIAEQVEFDGRNPRQLLIDSYNQLKNHVKHICGSSTACLVALHRSDCTLHSANLGDSGFLVMRNGRILHRSDEQQHNFNTPYQLTVPPADQKYRVHCDDPELAVTTHLPLQQGDLLLLATDGFFDNVPESKLIRLLSPLHGATNAALLQQTANRLVVLAKDLSLCSELQSPFSLKAKANNLNYGDGGKPDDITLILASVEVPKRY